ncbi:MAG: isoleucine--tRNA ligase [Nanoarchaeota archaeon]|nr:isoleucine--tRNA ligase [Nanoarchaeota archaeon]
MKTLKTYDFVAIQENVSGFWKEHNLPISIREKNKGKQKFYFLDGPPYTSGQMHIGTAWNKALKDMVIRYKRMQGFEVWDRAGYDMHGLPIEHATEKELGISGTAAIKEFGVKKFLDACKELASRNLAKMNQDFLSLGVWMDFENAYQTMSKTFMEGEWWFVKKAHENGRLYEGLRTMMWDAKDGTAVAKHETEYRSVEDTAIFVKFKCKDSDDYLVIWTTTPWTIPLNLAVMINPELDYVNVSVTREGKTETWWLAEELCEGLMKKIGAEFSLNKTVKGTELEGMRYIHPFENEMKFSEHIDAEKLHSILLSKEYVDTGAGSGLVHCAPGCGPEDFEVGYRNGLPAYNTVAPHGQFENSGMFDGLIAKKDDAKFIEMIDASGALVYSHPYVHDYPYAERSKQPVIFRTTKQWFLKIDDMKEKVIEENNGIQWIPKAAYNAFNAWLENLRDNSISKQRFWGTPIPVWRNKDDADDYVVIGSAKELEELSGQKVDDLHIDTVDKIEINKDGKTYVRIPDVLDVWVDAGTAFWNCRYHETPDDYEYVPADFILEGKDQVRGWFNLLHVCSMVAFGKKAFKNCYMHGYINDASGRKMSKSEKNFITPDEVTDKYGVDTFRFYAIGGANPAVDLNYNFDDIELRSRNLVVLWNIHNFVLDLQLNNGFSELNEEVGVEERYVLSRLNKTIKLVTQKLDEYKLNEVPSLIENFFLEDLSRTYIQLVRDKASSGSLQEKQTVFSTLIRCMDALTKMFAPVAPFISEQIYANFKPLQIAGLFEQESVHFESWPTFDESKIDDTLESGLSFAQKIITNGLAAREKAKVSVRWPLASLTLEVDNASKNLVETYKEMVLSQLNMKQLQFGQVPVSYEIKPDFRAIGKVFGQQTADVIPLIKQHEADIVKALEENKKEVTLEQFTLTDEMFVLTVLPKEGTSSVLFEQGKLMLDTTLTPELEAEGFARELARRIQSLRKESNLEKKDRVILSLSGPKELIDRMDVSALLEKVGADAIGDVSSTQEVKIKDQSFTLGISKVS